MGIYILIIVVYYLAALWFLSGIIANHEGIIKELELNKLGVFIALLIVLNLWWVFLMMFLNLENEEERISSNLEKEPKAS